MFRRIGGRGLYALVLLAAGCGSARYLKKTPTGGTLALEGDRKSANSEARSLMAGQCRNGYTVVSEGDLITGTEAERLQTTKTEFTCKAAPVKPPAPMANAPDAGTSDAAP
jgi:hypothetical protein